MCIHDATIQRSAELFGEFSDRRMARQGKTTTLRHGWDPLLAATAWQLAQAVALTTHLLKSEIKSRLGMVRKVYVYFSAGWV
jgi:hypothetical protein